MSEQEEKLVAIQWKLDSLQDERNSVFRVFNKHQRLKDFCGILAILDVLVGFGLAAAGMWVAAIGLVGVGLVFRFAEVFHGQIADRARNEITSLNMMIICTRGEYLEQ